LRDVLNIKKSNFITLPIHPVNGIIFCAILKTRLVFPLYVNEMAFVINGSDILEFNTSCAKSKIHYEGGWEVFGCVKKTTTCGVEKNIFATHIPPELHTLMTSLS
jgi:hypothetical protein